MVEGKRRNVRLHGVAVTLRRSVDVFVDDAGQPQVELELLGMLSGDVTGDSSRISPDRLRIVFPVNGDSVIRAKELARVVHRVALVVENANQGKETL
jgi:hypothetical protein